MQGTSDSVEDEEKPLGALKCPFVAPPLPSACWRLKGKEVAMTRTFFPARPLAGKAQPHNALHCALTELPIRSHVY